MSRLLYLLQSVFISGKLAQTALQGPFPNRSPIGERTGSQSLARAHFGEAFWGKEIEFSAQRIEKCFLGIRVSMGTK